MTDLGLPVGLEAVLILGHTTSTVLRFAWRCCRGSGRWWGHSCSSTRWGWADCPWGSWDGVPYFHGLCLPAPSPRPSPGGRGRKPGVLALLLLCSFA